MLRILLALASFSLVSTAQTGVAVPALAPFDQLMQTILARYKVPGGSIALTNNGRLVFARGYGYADQNQQTPVQPDSRFRLASLSKLITAVTILHLVEQGLLTLDQPAFALLPALQPPAGATADPRLGSITIRHLLNHSGGWDDSPQGSNFDPMFNSLLIASALDAPAPASTENIIRYMRGQPLQFDPGTRYVYSNFGYAVLGRVIERVTGMSYEQYVRTNVLAAMGISNMRIGQTLPQGAQPGEVSYLSNGDGSSVFPDTPGTVPWAYGGWYMESMDSHGGWIGSAIDYAKFVNAMDGRRGQRFLSPQSVAALTARPGTVVDWQTTSYWYGFGVLVRPSGTDANWWHSGSLDGTITYQVRTNDGNQWVVLLNRRPAPAAAEANLLGDLDAGLWNAAGMVAAWPSGDQFTTYPDSSAATTQPALTTREGVVNGATFDRGIVSGSWITLFGVNLTATTRIWNSSDFAGGGLPESLDGVSVKLNGQPAFVYYISPKQINVQAPSGLAPGWITAEVVRNGVSSGTVLTHAVQNAPGALTYAAGGLRLAVATTPAGVLIGDPSLSPGTVAAIPGSTIVLYSSGLAPSPAGVVSPPSQTAPVQVSIGNQTATVNFAGLVSPGLFQINAVIPAVPDRNQELVLSIHGVHSRAGTVIPVHH